MLKKAIIITVATLAIGFVVFWVFIREEKPYTEAENIYVEHCTSCHPAAPIDLTRQQWDYGRSHVEIFNSIKHGVDETEANHRFGEKLSDEKITALTRMFVMQMEEEAAERYYFTDSYLNSTIHSEQLDFRLDTVVTLHELPGGSDGPVVFWGLEFLPNGDLLISERSGVLYRFQEGGKLKQVSGIPEIRSVMHGGLLDVAVHPQYAENHLIYFAYSKPVGENKVTTAVMQARLDKTELSEQQDIFVAEPALEGDKEFGSRLLFDDQDRLLISVGNRTTQDMMQPQKLDNHLGKIHRLNDDGSIPGTNPFVSNEQAVASIYTIGHRNPQGLTVNPFTGTIWSSEHGPRGGDELNIIEPGKNYGWPVVTHGTFYDGKLITETTEKEGMESPFYHWVPSFGVCGIEFVNSERYGKWNGDLLVASLKYIHLVRFKMDGDSIKGEEHLLRKIGRLRTIKMGNDGYLYIAVGGQPGEYGGTQATIYRIVPV